MSLLVHITGAITGVAGGKVHATKARLRKTKRKTYDAACGRRVTLLGHPVKGGGHITQPWPPYVKDAQEWGGYERCPECLELVPGKPQRLALEPIGKEASQ